MHIAEHDGWSRASRREMRSCHISLIAILHVERVAGEDMTPYACHASAVSGRCLEYDYPTAGIWQNDSDCCACHDSSRCEGSYQKAIGLTSGNCHFPEAQTDCQVQTTCCIPIVADDGHGYTRSPSNVSSHAAAVTYCGADGLAIINSEVPRLGSNRSTAARHYVRPLFSLPSHWPRSSSASTRCFSLFLVLDSRTLYALTVGLPSG